MRPPRKPYASVENIFSSAFLPDSAGSTELSSLLRSNAVPPDPSYFQAVVASAHWEIARYKIDIRTLKHALDNLLSERDTFDLHVARCSSVLAPVRSLPSEILLRIFASFGGPDDSSDPWNEPPQRKTPEHLQRLAKYELRILSGVCCAWRTIIMGTPSLWTSVEVNFYEWFLPSIARRSTHL
ncbi:hypothetical protein C8R46DRAFT_1228976 [Mycena filopes]|nr:hypothetical protein C8R46DRAFT_1228976 [Mycena filopes]